jgi:multidrug resistance efflux pump
VADADERAAEIETAEENGVVRSILLNLDGAREHYRRSEQLFDEGLISRQALEEARFAMDRAESERDRPSSVELKRLQAHNRLNDMAAERIPLQSALTAAYHDLEQCRIEITRRSVTTPVSGVVTSLPKLKPGEFLNVGASVASIVPDGQPSVVEAWLATSDRTFVEPGQPVRMQVESIASVVPNTFDGKVASIAPDAVFNSSGAGAYRVLIRPAPAQSRLELGMTLQVHFITRQERLLMLLFQRVRWKLNDDSV